MNLKLYQLLETNDGFSCFMTHLIYEFSHECLLSFVEMVQWKKALHKDLMKFENNQTNQDALSIIHDDDDDVDTFDHHYKEEDDVLNLAQDKTKTYSMDLPKIAAKFRPKLFHKHSNSIDSTSNTQQNGGTVQYEDDKILSFQFPICVPLSSIVSVDILTNDDEINNDDFDEQRNIFLSSLNEKKK